MANQQHLDILKQGVERWNQWREKKAAIKPDFRLADLSDTILSYADLSHADLSYADLSVAKLRYANLSYAALSNATLSNATLSNADLSNATLRNADFSYSYLSNASLHDANLKGAIVAYTTFAHVDLHSVKGLVEVDHQGPSVVQLHTVQLPQDGSALHFLRGTGLPDEWIAFYRAQMMQPIVYHSCFISYSHTNEDFAKRLHADLQSHGVRCWFAPEDLKIGERIRDRIDEAIHMHDKLLLVLSEQAMASAWVEREVEAAFEKEQRQQRLVLFPVRLDEAVMQARQAWAADIRRIRHIGDFTRWKDHDAYQKAFTRLLRDLKAEAQTSNTPDEPSDGN